MFYEIKASLTGPLHIGSGEGENGEVLIHPVTRKPFIQASSIAGIMRGAMETSPEGRKNVNHWFGMKNSGSDFGNNSRIAVSDGIFDNIKMERRPRVSIDPISGSVSQSNVKGTSSVSGHKFEMDCVGAGNTFEFEITIDCKEDECENAKAEIIRILGIINSGEVQFGGQRSNGFGFVKIEESKFKDYNLKNPSDRKNWMNNERELDKLVIPEAVNENVAYRISIKGKTEGELLVKSIVVPEFGSEAPDAANITNAEKEYIIPGSSFKGSVRNRFEYVCKKLGREDIIKKTFGDTDGIGNIVFLDTVVGDIESNDRQPITHHIHVDKFTGGVFSGGLFSEKSIGGELDLRIDIRKSPWEKESFAVLMMVLRDLAIGGFNLGSGYANGRGFIDVSIICVSHGGTDYSLKIKDKMDENFTGLVNEALSALSETKDA